MTERYIERLLGEEADEAKVWKAIEEFLREKCDSEEA